MSFALTGQRGEASIRDVRMAMEDIGVIAKGRLISRKRLRRIIKQRNGEWESDDEHGDSDPDGEDESDESTESLEKLLDWFKGPQAAECRRVAGATSTSHTGLANGIGAGSVPEINHRHSFVAEYVTSLCP